MCSALTYGVEHGNKKSDRDIAVTKGDEFL